MTPSDATCPLCQRPVLAESLAEAWWADPTVVQRLADQHPTWRLPDGACPACLQEALLHVLLARGDAALHEQVQQLWPLDAARRTAGRGLRAALLAHVVPAEYDFLRLRRRVVRRAAADCRYGGADRRICPPPS